MSENDELIERIENIETILRSLIITLQQNQPAPSSIDETSARWLISQLP